MGAIPEDVHEICMALPEVELGTSWGDRPTYKVPAGPKGRGFLLYRGPRPDAVDPETGKRYDDVILITTSDEGTKLALAEDPATPFFTTDHFRGHSGILVRESRLGELSRERLAEVILEAWATVAPPRLVRARLG